MEKWATKTDLASTGSKGKYKKSLRNPAMRRAQKRINILKAQQLKSREYSCTGHEIWHRPVPYCQSDIGRDLGRKNAGLSTSDRFP